MTDAIDTQVAPATADVNDEQFVPLGTRWVNDPETGERVRREEPAPPIIDDDLCYQVKARQGELAAKPLARRGRPKHLLSGLLTCGKCGSGYIVSMRDWLGCHGHGISIVRKGGAARINLAPK